MSVPNEPTEADQPRELGVAVETCPECGNPVKQVEMPDGGVAGEPCPQCYPGETPVVGEIETASENPQGVDLREQGTDLSDIQTDNAQGEKKESSNG